jgi:hypothetical protein
MMFDILTDVASFCERGCICHREGNTRMRASVGPAASVRSHPHQQDVGLGEFDVVVLAA